MRLDPSRRPALAALALAAASALTFGCGGDQAGTPPPGATAASPIPPDEAEKQSNAFREREAAERKARKTKGAR